MDRCGLAQSKILILTEQSGPAKLRTSTLKDLFGLVVLSISIPMDQDGHEAMIQLAYCRLAKNSAVPRPYTTNSSTCEHGTSLVGDQDANVPLFETVS